MGFVSGYIDNQFNSAATAFEGLNDQAYELGTLPGKDATTADIALLPLKISFKLNMARQAWNASRTYGLTSSIADPFSMASYRIRRANNIRQFGFRGLVGNMLDDFSGGQSTTPRTRFKNWFAEKSITNEFSEKTAVDMAVAEGKMGAVENFILSKSNFHKTMMKMNPQYLEKFGGDKEAAYKSFARKVLDTRNKKQTLVTRKMSNGYMNKLMDKIHKDRMVTTRQFTRQGLDGMAEDLVGEKGMTDLGNLGRKRFSLFGKMRSRGERNTMAAAYEGLREFHAETGGRTTAESVTAMEDFANTVGRRLGMARKLKAAMWIGGIATAAIPLAATALKAYMTVPTRVSSTLEKFNRRDFGSGEILQNNSIATERQRSLMAIRDGQLNARSVMGNEAAFMH